MEKKIKTELRIVVASESNEIVDSLAFYFEKYGYKTLDAAYDGGCYVDTVERIGSSSCEYCRGANEYRKPVASLSDGYGNLHQVFIFYPNGLRITQSGFKNNWETLPEKFNFCPMCGRKIEKL